MNDEFSNVRTKYLLLQEKHYRELLRFPMHRMFFEISSVVYDIINYGTIIDTGLEQFV